MLKMKLVDRITNEELIHRIRENKTLWKNLKKSRTRMRHEGLDSYILEGEVGNKREGEDLD